VYDLLIRNGRVIDTAQNIDNILDVAVIKDKIALLAKDIPVEDSNYVIDSKGKIITPGLIDMHCHVYDGFYKIAAPPDDVGVKQGVTTIADGGSAGHATFDGFPRYVIPANLTSIFCFLHLGSIGQQVSCLGGGAELRDWEEIDPESTIRTIEANLGVIKGIKLRLAGKLAGSDGVKLVETAKEIVRKFGLPILLVKFYFGCFHFLNGISFSLKALTGGLYV
jgi:dihydroorotase